ncbi:MAG: hypothetical protein PF505_07215 [Vallitaleaceae bacterium]|jgi:hypothetical protein|nr:hypothetical protein [Vallitaleaceae bacterium]
MKVSLFNPMITKDVRNKLLLSLLIFASLLVFYYVLVFISQDFRAISQIHYMVALMAVGYYFMFKGSGKSRYFILFISPVGFFTLLTIILTPETAQGGIETALSTNITSLSPTIKTIIFVIVILIYVANGIFIMYDKAINKYMFEASQEKLGYMSK